MCVNNLLPICDKVDESNTVVRLSGSVVTESASSFCANHNNVKPYALYYKA